MIRIKDQCPRRDIPSPRSGISGGMAWKPSSAVSHNLIAMIMSESPTTVLSPGHLDSVRVQADTEKWRRTQGPLCLFSHSAAPPTHSRESFQNMPLQKGIDRHLSSVICCLAISRKSADAAMCCEIDWLPDCQKVHRLQHSTRTEVYEAGKLWLKHSHKPGTQ